MLLSSCTSGGQRSGAAWVHEGWSQQSSSGWTSWVFNVSSILLTQRHEMHYYACTSANCTHDQYVNSLSWSAFNPLHGGHTSLFSSWSSADALCSGVNSSLFVIVWRNLNSIGCWILSYLMLALHYINSVYFESYLNHVFGGENKPRQSEYLAYLQASVWKWSLKKSNWN